MQQQQTEAQQFWITCKEKIFIWAEIVAQLVERLLPIPEVRGSNPVIGKKLYRTLTVNCIVKTKIKKFFLKRENIFFSDYSLQLCRGSHHRSSRFDRWIKIFVTGWFWSSVTRRLNYFSTFGCLQHWKFAQSHEKFCQSGPKLYPITKSTLTNVFLHNWQTKINKKRPILKITESFVKH